jgi:hypothetical protein
MAVNVSVRGLAGEEATGVSLLRQGNGGDLAEIATIATAAEHLFGPLSPRRDAGARSSVAQAIGLDPRDRGMVRDFDSLPARCSTVDIPGDGRLQVVHE